MSLRSGAASALPRTAIASAARLLLPWAPFLALLAFGYRVGDWRAFVPAYGDVLEVLWGIEWYGEAIRGLRSPFFFDGLWHPAGFQVTTFAYGPFLFAALAPLYYLGGAAFAYNAAAVGSFFAAYAGMFRLSRLWLGPLAAALAALLFTFWGMRWLRVGGHMNVLLATSLLPWMVFAWERACLSPRRRWAWLLLGGGLWAAAIAATLYSLWWGGLLLGVWLAARAASGRLTWRAAGQSLALSAAAALLLSAPTIYWFMQGQAAAGAAFYSVEHIMSWGASLNSLPVPFVFHPWLGGLARGLYLGPVDESGVANLGLLATLAAVGGALAAWRKPAWRPLLALAAVGIVLSLGIGLRWNGGVIQAGLLAPLNAAIWSLGHWLKPDLFTTPGPPLALAGIVPLPGYLLTALLPFWEGARTVSRFIFVAGIGFFPLAALGVARLRPAALRLAVAALLVLEVAPPPTGRVPVPPPTHAAFAWLRGQPLAGEGIIDLSASEPDLLMLLIGGEVLMANRAHAQPTASAASSVWPAPTIFLMAQLRATPHPFQNPDFLPLLRQYRVRYVLLHMQGPHEPALLEEAAANAEIGAVGCFDPPAGASPWPYPICILEVLPAADQTSNLLLRAGFSGAEPWGRWVEGAQAEAAWAAPAGGGQTLVFEAFPLCVDGQPQAVVLWVNGQPALAHTWQNCEPWRGEVRLPPEMLRQGWNQVILQAEFAARPVDITAGANADTRSLSLGVTNLSVTDD